tara:strand:+ start:160 stop:318 length:159 start_codon:yes stop_codon:yes gene_type:complete
MTTPENPRSDFNRSRDEARSQIDSALASTPAFWIVASLVVIIVVVSIVQTFI